MSDPKELRDAFKAIYAALNQTATFPADIAYAKRIAKHFMDREQGNADLDFIRELEKRHMSSWTDEELHKYSVLTGQSE